MINKWFKVTCPLPERAFTREKSKPAFLIFSRRTSSACSRTHQESLMPSWIIYVQVINDQAGLPSPTWALETWPSAGLHGYELLHESCRNTRKKISFRGKHVIIGHRNDIRKYGKCEFQAWKWMNIIKVCIANVVMLRNCSL